MDDYSEYAELKGKRALVTGGSRGIGAAVVRQLLAAGAEVLVAARSATSPVPEGAGYVAADVRTPDAAATIAAAADERFGGVDIIVHNAGGAQPYPNGLAIPDDEWQAALELNLLASVRLDALLAPGMRARAAGSIVHISSAAVAPSAPPVLHYQAAKAALETYSKGLAAELAPSGVRVNVVSPGKIETPGGAATRQRWLNMDLGPGVDEPLPLGRDGTPDDIANAVLFLVSDKANWITGKNLNVDGGGYHRG